MNAYGGVWTWDQVASENEIAKQSAHDDHDVGERCLEIDIVCSHSETRQHAPPKRAVED